jgi:hypothetical protein
MQPNIQTMNYKKYHKVSKFKYLGSLVSYNNDCGRDIQARITAGNLPYQALSKIMKSSYI